jgi:hypothetical protein
MTAYTYTFLSLRSDEIIAEISLYGTFAQRVLSQPGQFTGSFNMDQTGKSNSDLVNATIPGKTWLVVERLGVPVWWGIVWSRTYQSQAKSCQMFAWGFEAYPQKRKIDHDISYTQIPVTAIFCNLWADLQSFDGSNLGINIPNIQDGPLKDLTVLSSANQYYNDPMTALAAASDGFDWTIDLEKNNDGTYTKSLRVGWPTIGTTKGSADEITFEYPGNIFDYYETEAMADAGTNVFVLGAGEGADMPVVETTLPNFIASGWPRWDADAAYKDVSDPAQIAVLAATEQINRKPPAPTYTITVNGAATPVVGSYNLGDACTLQFTDPKHPSDSSLPGTSIKTVIAGFSLTPSQAGSIEAIDIQLPGDISVQDDSVVDQPPVSTVPITPIEPPPPPSAPTLYFGVAIGAYPNSGHSKQTEYNAYTTSCGVPDYLRVYLNSTQSTLANFPTSWPVAGELTDYQSRGTYLSFKPDLASFASGAYDAKLTALINSYDGLRLDLTCYHEPEDDIEASTITLANWVNANAHMAALVTSINNPKVSTWATMGGFTWNPASGRNPNDYYVPGLQGYGIDQYNDPSARHDTTHAWIYPAALMDPFTSWANSKGVLKGWIEIGCAPDFNDVNKRVGWLQQVGPYLVTNGYARASYFDLVGPKADWEVRAIVQRTAYFPATLGTVTSVVADPASAAAWRAATGK